jgi:ABC-type transporter Mla subunit MlaD
MNIAIKVAIAAGAITLAALCIWGCFGLCQHIIVAVDRWGAAAPDAGKIDAVLDHVNRPCKGASGPDACGTLAQINKTAIDAGDAIVRTQLIERTAQPHIVAAMDEFGQTAKHLSSTADSLKGTADALTGTAQGATDTLAEGKRTIAAAQPLLAQLTANGASLQATTDTINDILKRQAIGKLLDNAAGISGDFRTIADKATADFIRPVPWWQQPIKKSGQLIDIGAAIARHTP